MGGEPWLATVTHARLRASQGDVAGARGILERILAERPDDREARGLLERLLEDGGSEHQEPAEEQEPPPQRATASEIEERFRAALGGGRSGVAGGVRSGLVRLLAGVRA